MSVDLSVFNSLVQRLESVADRLERGGGGGGGAAAAASGAASGGGGADDAAVAVAFDAFIKEKAAPIEAAASALAVADVTEATQFFMQILRLLRDIFNATGKCKKPKDDQWGKFFTPISEINQKAAKACDNRSDYFHNRKAACEALGVAMLVMAPGPGSHIQSVLESSDFHAIKVMTKKNPPETAWINALKTCLKELTQWCNENIKMGLTWKADGQDALEYFTACPLGSAAPAGAPAAKAKGKGKGGAPPIPKGGLAAPPPWEGESPAPKSAPAAGGGGGGMSAVFDAINKGGTGGLKKVTDDMKCKNMKDVAVREAPKPKPKPAAKTGGGRFVKGPKGDPVKALKEEQNMWFVANFEGDHNIVVDEADKQHGVRISDCKNCTVKISCRVKSVSVDSCERISVITGDVISAVEAVNTDRLKLQASGKVNLYTIDKCDGVNVWLNKDSIAAEIVTSKSSEMNVTIPDDQGDEYDTIEIPIPEQFKNTISGRKLKTEVSELYSS